MLTQLHPALFSQVLQISFKYKNIKNLPLQIKTTHHDTTILFSLDSCYMFAHKRNYLAVVSETNRV